MHSKILEGNHARVGGFVSPAPFPQTKSVPRANPRLEMPRIFLEAAVDWFRNHVHNACAKFVFNLDEVGSSRLEDKVETKVIVPLAVEGQMTFHNVHRNLKHISIVTCISAAGEHMIPFMVCSRLNGTVERLLKLRGFRFVVELILRKRDKLYMDSQLFHEYMATILIHYIKELPTNDKFAGKNTVLLMDNCAIHVQSDLLRFRADHQGKVITLPPHTNQIFQSLDLSLFGNFKKKMNYRVPLETDETIAGFVTRICHAME
jgi:hypothetical protein